MQRVGQSIELQCSSSFLNAKGIKMNAAGAPIRSCLKHFWPCDGAFQAGGKFSQLSTRCGAQLRTANAADSGAIKVSHSKCCCYSSSCVLDREVYSLKYPLYISLHATALLLLAALLSVICCALCCCCWSAPVNCEVSLSLRLCDRIPGSGIVPRDLGHPRPQILEQLTYIQKNEKFNQ